MNPINKFWWFVATSALITVVLLYSLAWLFWQQLTPPDKIIIESVLSNNFIYIFSALMLIFACLIFVFDGILHVYILPAKKLIGETQIINSVNNSHRIHIEGSRDIMRLADVINEGAERYENLQRNVDEMIHFARTESEKERTSKLHNP